MVNGLLGSESLEENGLLKSDITADGIHLKTKDNYKVLLNNIKNKNQKR